MRISYAVFCLKKKKKRNSTRRQELSTYITPLIFFLSRYGAPRDLHVPTPSFPPRLSSDLAAALNRLDTMICRLPSAINFFKLLEARPGLTAMLSEILSHAPVLAEALAQRTELLDGLIDATADRKSTRLNSSH